MTKGETKKRLRMARLIQAANPTLERDEVMTLAFGLQEVGLWSSLGSTAGSGKDLFKKSYTQLSRAQG